MDPTMIVQIIQVAIQAVSMAAETLREVNALVSQAQAEQRPITPEEIEALRTARKDALAQLAAALDAI